MSFSRAATFDDQRALAFSAMGAAYVLVGGSLFLNPNRIIIVQNLTDALLQFSTDGVNDHFPLPANGQIIIDLAANDADEVPWFLPARQGIYVKDIESAASGSVYVSVIYGRND